MILSLFGDKHFRALKLTSVADMNDGHCGKLTKRHKYKLFCMNISGGE